MLLRTVSKDYQQSTPTFAIASNHTTIQDFKARLRGELISPGDESYDHARMVWNGMIDRYPALIVRCADLIDILNAIQFARSQDLPVSVRGGGHSALGNAVSNGGIVIDLSGMKALWIDPIKRIAHAQPGLTLGEFINGTQAFGLATTTGNVSGTGLSGLTLGGGLGWLMGKNGLTIDNLLSVDLVTADGQVLTASATEHPDLFWGVRGGGGNFGIITSFEFQLHPVGPVLAGKVVYPVTKAREVLRFYREYTSTAPDELTVNASLVTTPGGLPAVEITLCYGGSLEEGLRLVEPLRKFSSPLVDLIRPKSLYKVISMADAGVPDGRNYYQKASTLKHLSDEVIDTIADYGAASTSPFSQVLIQHVHGAASRVSPTETAFALRDVSYVTTIIGAWDKGEANQHIEWTNAFRAALEPFATSGVYINFLGDEGEKQVQASYGANYERLVSLKNRYDPMNFFHFNQNIKPSMPFTLSTAKGLAR
jgi:FAD/FMN-containing dehydrogenase